MHGGDPAEIVIIGIETFGRLALGSFDLGLLQLGCDRAYDAAGHLILEIEDILNPAIEAIDPDMRTPRGIDKLPSDPHPASRPAHAAFQHIAHAELTTHLLYVHRATLIGEGRIARDDEQPAHARQRRNDLLDHAISEVFLLGIAA